MIVRNCLSVTVSMLLFAGICNAQSEGGAGDQFPMVKMVGDKIIKKYETSSCEQLWKQKSQPKSEMEERAVHLLRTDPAMRAALINQVAAPIANKLFECGMIP